MYQGDGEWLHLTMSPRIVKGGLEMTADKVDVSRQSGDAFAHGNVKATQTGGAPNGGGSQGRTTRGGMGQGSMALGGNGPAHVIAAKRN